MILRSITEHVKAQNWTAVALDFFIVVVGVFIGIQVSNWNDGRSDRARESAIIEALKQDFRKLDGWVSSNIESHERGIDGLTVIADAIDAGNLPQDKRQRFENGLRYGYINSSFPASATLNEITASGQLSLIRDQELRGALATYDSFRAASFRTSSDIRSIAVAYMPAFTSRFRYNRQREFVDVDDDSARNWTYTAIGDYDFDAMADDPGFYEAVEELRETQILWLNWQRATQTRLRQVRDSLGDPATGENK